MKRIAFNTRWLGYSFIFLVIGEILDGVTTKIGLDLGSHEVGAFAAGVNGSYGFWGLMAWKYALVAALGAMFCLIYFGVKKKDPKGLPRVSKILTLAGLLAGLISVEIVVSNIIQIEIALHSMLG
jgi:hypothetical protein